MRFLFAFLIFLFPAVSFADSASALDSAYQYAEKNAAIAKYIRFLDISTIPVEYRIEVLKVLAFQINNISTEPEPAIPKVVSAEVIAINVLELDSDNKRFLKVWEKLADVDPYFHTQTHEFWPGGFDKRYGKEFAKGNYLISKAIPPYKGNPVKLAKLIALTHSNVPIVRADWWFVQSARQLSLNNKQTGVGYYDFLALKNRKDFENLVAFDEKRSLDFKREIRAIVKDSGVATQNRQIFRGQSIGGGYWVTFDTDDSTGRKNAIENPGRKEFLHLAEELYGVLPNGLFAFFLCNAAGDRQDTAPDFIGSDDSILRQGKDARIHVGISCVRCHLEGGLRPINDWFRTTLVNPLAFQSPDYKKFYEIRRAYFSNLQSALDRDREVYISSLKAINGLSPADNAKAYARFWDYYAIDEVGTEVAAREIGVTEEYFVKCLKDYAQRTGQLDLILSGLLANPPVKIRREHWEELYPVVREILK